MEGVTRVEGGVRLDEVAGEEHALLGQPRDHVTLGVAAAAPAQDEIATVAPEGNPQLVGKGDGRVGQSRDLLRLEERHPAELALPVLFPRSSMRRRVDSWAMISSAPKAGPEHSHGVVVGQHDMAHGLVGVLAQLGQPLAGRGRCRPDVEADEEVLALDGADVRVPSAVRA